MVGENNLYELRVLSNEEWALLGRTSHALTFGEMREPMLNRHHFTVAVMHSGDMGGFFTCLEMDSETLYIQHGGVLPNFQKTIHATQGYAAFIDWCEARYKRLTTKIENINAPMLRLAMKMGFLIVGTSTFKNKIYLDHLLEVQNG